MPRPPLAVGLAIALALVAVPAAAEAPEDCVGPIEARLEALGIPAAQVERLELVPRRVFEEDGEILLGYDAWARLRSCPGYVVLELDTDCRFRAAHARGACRVPGLRTYR